MKKENKKAVMYNPTVLLKNVIISQLLLLYITLSIGDSISLFSDFSDFITRYLPIGIVTLISSYFLFKKNISKCLVKDKEDVKKKVILAPIIVAVILLGYGLYSVESNSTEIRKELNKLKSEVELYAGLLPDVEEQMDELEEQFKSAIAEARINWFITSVIYLAVAEFVAYMSNKKLDVWLTLEEPMTENLDNNLNTVEESNYNFEPTETVTQPTENSLNNIKWDL